MTPIRTLLQRSWLAAGLASVLTAGVVGLSARPAAAHEATCPYCRLDVVQDTDRQDNEVALKYGRKRIEYRCVYCALAQAKTEFKGDLTILTPSEIKGKPVLISRKEEKWAVMPESAVFSAQKVNHSQCQVAYRAFSTPAAFEAYAKQHPELFQNARPLTLAQMVEIAK